MESNDFTEKKTIALSGTNNRYQMKKVMKVKEPLKKRKITEKWILKEEDYTYEKQRMLLSSLILKNEKKEKEKDNIDEKETIDLIQQQIERKIASYKQQDLEKNKYDSKNTIQYNQVLNLLYESECLCFYCRKEVLLLYENVREKKQWTLDRIDNDLGHNTNNVIISCLECNLKRRRQSKDGFLFTKQLTIVKQEKDLSNSNDTA
jgi:hypothetical protein